MEPYAIMFRNQQDNQLFDVAIIDPEIAVNSQVVLNRVSFELASAYTRDYNSSNKSTK